MSVLSDVQEITNFTKNIKVKVSNLTTKKNLENNNLSKNASKEKKLPENSINGNNKNPEDIQIPNLSKGGGAAVGAAAGAAAVNAGGVPGPDTTPKVIGQVPGTVGNNSNIQFPDVISDTNRKITFSVWNPNTVDSNDYSTAFNTAMEGVKNTVSKSDIITPNNSQINISSRKGTLHDTITLPLPNSIRDSQGHYWGLEEGIIGTLLGSITKESVGSMIAKAGGGIGESVSNFGNKFSLLGNGIKAITNQIGSRISNVSVDQALGSLSASKGFRKPLADPGYFQNYSGSKPRSFSMSWDFTPQSKEESQKIFDIITSFKYYSSPSTFIGSGITLQAPCFFTMKISNVWLENLILPGRVVITDINIDYGSEGGMVLHNDGFPKMISFAISFSDLTMRYAEDYDPSGNGWGNSKG